MPKKPSTPAWRSDPPIENGLYWAIPVLPRGVHWERGPIPQLVSVEDAGDGLVVFVSGKDYSYDLSDFSHWQGPILPPDPPEL